MRSRLSQAIEVATSHANPNPSHRLLTLPPTFTLTRYTGCSAVVQIQRSGYPVAFVLKDFVATYRCIAFREPKLIDDELPNADIVKNLLVYGQGMSTEKDQPGWLALESGLRVQIGKTKVFMRDDVLKHLEGPKNEVHGGAALVVQTAERRHAVLPLTLTLTLTLTLILTLTRTLTLTLTLTPTLTPTRQ